MKILLVMRIPKHKILFMMVTMKLVVNRQFPIQNVLLVANSQAKIYSNDLCSHGVQPIACIFHH